MKYRGKESIDAESVSDLQHLLAGYSSISPAGIVDEGYSTYENVPVEQTADRQPLADPSPGQQQRHHLQGQVETDSTFFATQAQDLPSSYYRKQTTNSPHTPTSPNSLVNSPSILNSATYAQLPKDHLHGQESSKKQRKSHSNSSQSTPPISHRGRSSTSSEELPAKLMNTNSVGLSQAMPGASPSAPSPPANTRGSKPKRVRTGCLTCRERHLKCDEALPHCMNCRKSARICRRGIRLNFIDTRCKQPPVSASSGEWNFRILDESRDIASEYIGGAQRYPPKVQSQAMQPSFHGVGNYPTFVFSGSMAMPSATASTIHQQPLPSIQGMLPMNSPEDTIGPQYHQQDATDMFDSQQHQQQQLRALQNSVESAHSTGSMRSIHPSQHQRGRTESYSSNYFRNDQPEEIKEILNTPDETFYMQVFVEEVGLWMDSMDPMKHFSELLPFHALQQPMLFNAFLACGVRHLTLINPGAYRDETALQYYDKASRYLLRALENPERDSVICATTAVILNVYEIMTEKALPRMNHIAGARALIKECGWSARSTGIGAACFWINVGMELLSNLHFNWRASWDPDAWGFDLDLTLETQAGREELWTHRVVYITAKVGNFRASASHAPEPNGSSQERQQKRYHEWCELKGLVDAWNQNGPRTMQPLAYLYPYQTRSTSAFPEVWLIKRTTIVARLFYHTAMVLLAQSNPLMSNDSPEMHDMELEHAHQICGITAHVKDRGVASVALRSLAIAAECLTVRREQEEVLKMFVDIHRETGWRIGFIPKELAEKWGWDYDPTPTLPTHANPLGHLTPAHASNGYNSGMMNSNGAGARGNMQRSGYLPRHFDQYGDMQERLQQQQRQQQQQTLQRRLSSNQQQSPPQQMLSSIDEQHQQQPQSRQGGNRPSQKARKFPEGIVNPLLEYSDFKNEQQHPYQENYVAPRRHSNTHSRLSFSDSAGGGLGLGFGGLIGHLMHYGNEQHPQVPSPRPQSNSQSHAHPHGTNNPHQF